ncbi:hypothetical protein VPLG_00049 [Vibrio phage eugene 12A10]|uniref:hypothetical protein n=1 Tax=Vibrio phage eugene 12A10 TaxID=573172 RepID=UPI000351C669|nr:hypothetical protein VPLG_00049 [Vibrio phage eugene 12A10]AGN51488.1 hypothetical protein VPLG_00049 [Vibrio phage eugene 12A10]
MEYFHFKKVNNLRAFLAKRHEEINLNASISQPSFYFVTTDKVVHRATGTKMLAQVLNDLFGNYYSVEDSTTVTRQRGTLAYALQEKVETTVQEEKEVVSEPEVEEVVEDLSNLISLEVEEEVVTEDVKDPDWAWIESLENTPEDKLEFDKYCESEFSVKLSRTMKLSNMIKKFKEELAKR